MPRMEGILNLPVQDPLCPEFSAAHINWVKLEGGRQCGDNIALIPFARVDDFVKGESSNPECPASFRLESRRKRPVGSIAKPRVDGYLEYTLYWCSYGPKDYRESDSGGRELCMHAPRISDELRQKVMSMLYVGISLDKIIQHHAEDMQKQGGPQNRDDFLTRNDVRNMERTVRNSSNELHENDECSVKIWVQQHQKHVFYFQDNSSSEPFVLGIQTDWQLQQMLRFGNNSFISFHSSFGLKKLKYPICSLLVFNSSQNAIPVAWIITSSFVGKAIHKWIDPRWRPNAILLDDPSLDYSIIREAFRCRILLCAWHVRRTWIKKLFKKCCNIEVQREMFRHLGWILYCTKCGPNAMDAVEELMQIFVDQCAFMDYFKSHWLGSIDMWINAIKSLSVTTPEPHAAIESYHLKLKSMLLKENYASFWPRVDWLIHTLTTEFHSLYWLDQYSLETGYFENLRDNSFSSNVWYHALHIPDVDVILDEQNLHLAKVATFCRSQQVARPSLSTQGYKQALLTLLHNPPDDPLVLDLTILHVTHLQQDIKALEDFSNNGLLQPIAPDLSSQT
uniref:MULE transposase domain-containing protein n=1 Tax=Glycine max TaxID=3847 RepID=A0A0R0JDB0_SOYBN